MAKDTFRGNQPSRGSLDPQRRLAFERSRLWFRLALLVGPLFLWLSYGQAAAGIIWLITALIVCSSAFIWLLGDRFPNLILQWQLSFRLVDIGLIYLVLYNAHPILGGTYYSFIYILPIISATATHARQGMLLTAVVASMAVLIERGQLAFAGMLQFDIGQVADVGFHMVIFFVTGAFVNLMILQRNLAEEQVRVKGRHAQALVKNSALINAKLELKTVLGAVCEATAEALDVPVVTVSLYDSEKDELHLTAAYGLPPEYHSQFQPLPGKTYKDYSDKAGPLIYIADVQELGNLPNASLYRKLNLRTTVGTSMLREGRLIGRLNLGTIGQVRHFNEAEFDLLKGLANQAALAIANASLFNELQKSIVGLSQAYDTTLEGWVKALELRDGDTEGHTQRVTGMTLDLAAALGLPPESLIHIRRGALLHDIGKMAIPDAVLSKPDALTEQEWKIMKRHPVYAREWLYPIAYLRSAVDIPYCHHEKWDGTGYPLGLRGGKIPLAARVFSVVDVWDALCSDRPYRKAWPQDKVIAYLQEQAGKHFDPAVVDAFLKLLAEKGMPASP